MNYGSVRLAKSWLPNREWFDGNVQEDDWGSPLHVFIGSPQQRGLLLPCWSQRSMKVPQGLEHPCLSSTCSVTGQSLCQHGFLVSSPAGRPSVLSFAWHCHQLSPLGSPGGLRGTAPAMGLALGNLVFPVGAVEGGSSAGGWRTRALNSLMTHCLIFRKGLPITTSQSPHCKWR